LSGRGLRRHVHHGFPSSVVVGPGLPPDIQRWRGRMSPIRGADAKSFGGAASAMIFLRPAERPRLKPWPV